MLFLQASMLQRIQALTSLLDSALAESEQQPQQPLPGLAVTFAATQVQVSAFLLPLKNMFLPSYQSSPHVCLLAAIQVHVFACLLPFNHTFLPPCCHSHTNLCSPVATKALPFYLTKFFLLTD